MRVFTGTVIPVVDDDSAVGVVSDDDFPFLAMVSDQDGNVVAQFPVRTEADGHAKLEEAIAELKRQETEGQR
jgi:CBS domain-containing protein